MLDSMINSPSPTRAEASDVATAVFDAADSLMLSAETASGKFPVESVQIMDRIIRGVEFDPSYRQILDSKRIKFFIKPLFNFHRSIKVGYSEKVTKI